MVLLYQYMYSDTVDETWYCFTGTCIMTLYTKHSIALPCIMTQYTRHSIALPVHVTLYTKHSIALPVHV